MPSHWQHRLSCQWPAFRSCNQGDLSLFAFESQRQSTGRLPPPPPSSLFYPEGLSARKRAWGSVLVGDSDESSAPHRVNPPAATA
eukprot:1415150-Rhodomonas_salina.2